MSAAITPHDFPDVRWHGHWIVVEPPPPPRFFPGGARFPEPPRHEERGLLRKTFTLDQVPARVPARLTADSRYRLYVNGQEVAHGPIRSQPRRLSYDMLDLAPFLRPGENTIAVYLLYYGATRAFWQPAPRSALGQHGVLVFEADLGAAGWLISDDTWKAVKGDAWPQEWRKPDEPVSMFADAIPTEVVDARLLPFGWEQPGFDDCGWGTAHKAAAVSGMNGGHRTRPPTDPYGPLYPRPIACLGGDLLRPIAVQVAMLSGGADESTGDPVKRLVSSLDLPTAEAVDAAGLPLSLTLSTGGSARITLDFGRLVMGQAQFELHAPAGTVIDMSFKEDVLVKPRGFYVGQHAGARYICRGEDDRFKLYDAQGLRYAYLLVHSTAGPVVLADFAVQEDLYPWQAGAGFRCSDDTLNGIFKAGVRTVQLNSRDSFTDCPTREQQAWVGDSVVHQMVHLATNPDWRLAWQYLNLSNSPRADGILPESVVGQAESSGGTTIPDWSLHWVHGVYNLYRFSGDRAAVKALMPTVERVLRWYAPYQNRQGLLKDVGDWSLIDWSAVSVDDTSSIINALWARGLAEFAEMAGWLGEQASQAWADQVYAAIRAGFEVFWDEARGSYIDHIVDGQPRPEMSQIAGAAAIVSGLAPQERWSRIIDTITDAGRLTVYTWMWGAGSDHLPPNPGPGPRRPGWDVERQIVQAEPFMQYVVHDAVARAGAADRLPGLCRQWAVFLRDGYDTIGENWRRGTHVHGWSCTPTKDLVFYTLGVTPAEPGYAVARIAPRLGDLTWAEGAVPTPCGLIHVRAEAGSLAIESPVPVVVDLPGQAPRRLPAGRHTV